jgi:hypothetical protein
MESTPAKRCLDDIDAIEEIENARPQKNGHPAKK